jgi:hypothetical protein
MRKDFKRLQEVTTAHIQDILHISNPHKKETVQFEVHEGETFEVIEPDSHQQHNLVKESLEEYCKELEAIAGHML